MATKIVLISGTASLDKAISTFAGRASKLQGDLHRIACSVLAHAIQHKDIRPMAKLLAAVPSSQRGKALAHWFEAFGPVNMVDGVPAFSKAKVKSSDLNGAIATPFWDFTKEVSPKEFNLVDALSKLIDKAVKANADNATVGVLKAQLAALTAPVTVQ